jgi:P63C domain
MADIEYIKHQIITEIKVDELTGKGTCSIRGTARLADISDSSLVRAFNSAVLEPSKLATFLIINGFDGAALASFSESGVPDLAVGAILEYYAFEAGRYCTEQSKLVFRVMARIGVRAWMQDVVGYKKPTEEKIDFEAFLIKQLPYEAKKWEAKFKPEFWEALENLYGLKRGQQACGKFISHWIYKYFPQEVIERIAEINPLNEKGTRKNRIHQHFDDVLSKALDMQISMVTCNLIKSKSRHHFKRLMSSAKRYKFTFDSLKKLSGGENV